MKHSWKIGKIFGIEIHIDSSWFVIFILFTWVLANTYFPQQYPEWRVSVYWVIGIFTSLSMLLLLSAASQSSTGDISSPVL